MPNLHAYQQKRNPMPKPHRADIYQHPSSPVQYDDHAQRERDKLELIRMVDDLGVSGTRALLPKLGMTEHYGLATVTTWLNGIAASIGQ